MPTLEDLHRMSQTDKVNRDALVDINDVTIDPSLPAAQRMENYLSKIKNPYHYRCGTSVIHLRFASAGTDLKSHLKIYMQSLKNV